MRLPKYQGRYAEFVGHVATMMSGKSIAAAIALLTTPIVARLFEPSDFGVAAVFASIVGVTSNVASLRYGSTLVIPRDEDEALALMSFSYRITFVFCLLMYAGIWAMDAMQVGVRTLELLGLWMWLLPVGTFLMEAISLQETWLTRQKKFGVISASLVAGNTVTSGSRILLGMAIGTTVWGLVVGYLLGMFVRLATQWRAGIEGWRATVRPMDCRSMQALAKEYSDFPLYNAPAGLVFSLGQNLPVMLFGSMFSPAVAGLYAMANRLSKVPVTIGATALRRVFLQKAAAIHNSGRSLRKALLLTMGTLFAVGILPVACVWFYGEPMLTWLLGGKWAEAGRYMEIIAPWMFMIWVTSPCNAVFIILRRQRFWLVLQSILTVFRLLAFVLGYMKGAGPEWTLGAFVVATIAGNLVTIIITTRLTANVTPTRPAMEIGQ